MLCKLPNGCFKGAYWTSSNSSFIQYCDSNIEQLFSIAPPLVIALPTLLQFLYKFCRLVHGFFSVLLPIQ